MDLLATKSTSLALFTVYKNLPKEVQDEFQLLLILEKQAIEASKPKPKPETYYSLYFESWDTELDAPRLLRPTIGLLDLCGTLSNRAYSRLNCCEFFFIEDIMQEYKEKGHLRFIRNCGKKTEAEILASIQKYYALVERSEELLQDSTLSEDNKFLLTPFLRPARKDCFLPLSETNLSKKALIDAKGKKINTINDLLDYFELYRNFEPSAYYKSEKGVIDKELLTLCLSYLTPLNSADTEKNHVE